MASGTSRKKEKRRELLAIIRQGKLIFGSARGKRGEVDPTAERVVVFLHGFMARGAVFDPLARQVETELGIETARFSYGPHRTFVEVAGRFEAWIDSALPKEVPLALVGHSLGGLFARWYHQESANGHRVRQIITLATPHGGTVSARHIPVSLARALAPGGPILTRLDGGKRTAPLFAVVAGADRTVTPPESAGQVVGADVSRFDDLGHNETLFDPRVHDLVVRTLAGFGQEK